MSEGSNVKFSEAEALEFHSMGRPGKIEIIASKPMATQRDLSLAYSPGVAVPVRAIAEDPGTGLRLYRQGQSRRGHLQRHRHPRPRQSRRARRQAGDGRQGGAVQALRRRRFDRHRARHRGSRQVHRGGGFDGAELRRHQPRGHRRARMLHHRADAARADEHPGHARRPARHRDHQRRRADQRLLPHRPQAEGHQGGGERRRRRGDRLHRADQGDGRAARPCHHVRPQGRDLPGPRGARPVEVGACGQDRARARSKRR